MEQMGPGANIHELYKRAIRIIRSIPAAKSSAFSVCVCARFHGADMLSFFSTPFADTHVSQLASGSAPHTKSSLD